MPEIRTQYQPVTRIVPGVFEQIVEPTRNESVSVGTSSSVIAQARNAANKRKVILIRNISTGTQVVTINPGFGAAVANTGIILQVGESYSDSTDAGYECFQGMITAISDQASATLAIYER